VAAPHSPIEADQHDTPPKSKPHPPKLYVDQLLENRDTHGIGELRFESCVIKVSSPMLVVTRIFANMHLQAGESFGILFPFEIYITYLTPFLQRPVLVSHSSPKVESVH
jgi:hypothetical protein